MANVNSNMSIRDVLQLDDSTSDVFLSFGMTCLTCPFATAESLAEAAGAHGVDVNQLVEKLNQHLEAQA